MWSSWRRFRWQVWELEALANRHGLEGVHIVNNGHGEDASLDEALARVKGLRNEHPFVAHFVFEEEGHASEVEAAFPRLATDAAVTYLVRPWLAVTRGDLERPGAAGPHHASIVTDPTLAARDIYPAVDPEHSASSLQYENEVAARVAREARGLLSRYRAHRRDGTPMVSQEIEQATRLEAFLTQPFHVATPDTTWVGVDVDAADTFDGVERILKGEVRESAERLLYRGAV